MLNVTFTISRARKLPHLMCMLKNCAGADAKARERGGRRENESGTGKSGSALVVRLGSLGPRGFYGSVLSQ